MRISDLPFGSNIKIPERREDGTYELAGYTLGCLNNFDVGTAGLRLSAKTYTACAGSGTARSTSDQTWTNA